MASPCNTIQGRARSQKLNGGGACAGSVRVRKIMREKMPTALSTSGEERHKLPTRSIEPVPTYDGAPRLISLHSEVQRGNGFMIRQNRSAQQTQRPLVGIVDDDASVRDSISSLVRSAGYRAMTFPSAEAFLSSDHMHDMECLILDVRMAGLSGLDLQRQLHSMRCSIPVIFATAHTDDEVQERALAQGAVAFLHKPFNDEALLDAAHSALS